MSGFKPLDEGTAEQLQNKLIGSILNDVKDSLGGIAEDYTEFDTEVCGAINTALSILVQLGVIAPSRMVLVQNDSLTWEDLIDDGVLLYMARQYVKDKVKLIFDPPASGTLHAALERRIEEMGWRAREAAMYT